ncbi:uncharacterized protein LOC9630918 [Selaginella moellendorffii]|nr:uncharacterized protein LOC9655626 [Selaginella moellendorffii]XP_024528698.1 uncharacterized protein LOC9630918 [Selaginella moellendorffii]|eukprot:XP_024525125.1 uncharacterized protein LOC9655626 [Selaginella moellendorffii]
MALLRRYGQLTAVLHQGSWRQCAGRSFHCDRVLRDDEAPDAGPGDGGEEQGKKREYFTTVSRRYKARMAVERLFKRAAAKEAENAASGDQEAKPDVTTISIDPAPHVKTKKLGKTAAFIMEILNKEAVAQAKQEREIPALKPGYVIRVKVEEPQNKRRIQEYKGIIIAMRNNGIHTTFRLRRQIGNTFVENVLPLYSPLIKEFEILDIKKVRRAKLYYLRRGEHKLKSLSMKKRKLLTAAATGKTITPEFKLPPPPASD